MKKETVQDWPRFRLTNDNQSVLGTTEIKEPKEVWRFDTGGIIESSPAVVGNKVFIGGHCMFMHCLLYTSPSPRDS